MKIGKIDKTVAVRLKNDANYFCEKILGVKLHHYQQQVVNEKHRNLAMCWSRQTGKTFLLSIKAVHEAVTFVPTETKKEFLVMVLSQDRERAREFYNLILQHIHSNPLLAGMIEGDPKQSETKLSNGSRIINKAGGRDGKALRGYSVDLLIIDEADFIPNPVFVAGEQCTASVRGKIWLISTPNRKATTFYKYFNDGLQARRKYNNPELLEEGEEQFEEPIGREFNYKSYHVHWTEGLKAFKPDGTTQLDKDFIMKKKNSMAKWEFEQEYEAIWSDDIASYFNEKQVRACVDPELTPERYVYERIRPNDIIYVGIDFAKHKDRTVVVAITKVDNQEYQVQFTYEMEGRDWDRQLIEINAMMMKLRPTKVYIDKTGLGDVMFDLMTRSQVMPNGDQNYMLGLVDNDSAISMSIQSKSSMYSHLQHMIGNRLIRLPNHKRMLQELIMLQYEKTNQSEWVRILAPEKTVGEDIHDDYPDALALACKGTEDDYRFFGVDMVGIRKGLSTTTVPSVQRERPSFFGDDRDQDLDAWEQQAKNRGAKVTTLFGETNARKPGIARGRSWSRKNSRIKRF